MRVGHIHPRTPCVFLVSRDDNRSLSKSRTQYLNTKCPISIPIPITQRDGPPRNTEVKKRVNSSRNNKRPKEKKDVISNTKVSFSSRLVSVPLCLCVLLSHTQYCVHVSVLCLCSFVINQFTLHKRNNPLFFLSIVSNNWVFVWSLVSTGGWFSLAGRTREEK